MEFESQSVVHIKYGRGKIKSRDGNAIAVTFDAYGTRTFLYPQSFEKHLQASDPEFAKEIAADLNKEWEERSNKELALRKHAEELAEQARQERMYAKKPLEALLQRSS